MAGQPKTPFYIVLVLVVVALVALAIKRWDVLAPQGNANKAGRIDPGELGQKAPLGKPGAETATVALGKAESTDNATPPVTTVKEYKFKPAERLPEIKGTSAYKPMENNTVRFALNVWAGWGPIILANNGFKPEKVWKTPDGEEFRVELVLIDDPGAMIGAYAAGQVHIGWGTLDMVPLFIDGMVDRTGKPKDSRVMPRIYQQIDWSNGGDGIVVREDVKTVADLRDKKLVLAQNSPSQYFALNMLVAGGVQPSEVNMIYTNTAFEAAAAFASQKDISGAVSWSPDIYNLAKAKGNRMLVNTQTANKLIADVWFARADFAKDHPGIIEGLVRGIFDAMEEMKKPEQKAACSKLMAAGYNIPADDAMAMFGDAHNTNWAENFQFFLNQNNPTNFERVWRQAYYLYRQIGTIQNSPMRFDQVMDFSVIQKLGNEEKYKSQKDEYQIQLAPKTVGEIRAESDEILTNTVVIHFFPNDWNLHKKITREVDGKSVEEPYDPNVDNVLEGVAKLIGQFGAARVVIEGHTDSSQRGQVPVELVKELSMNRANAVREALVQKFNIEPNRLMVDGLGWDRPADLKNPFDQAKNRRVEIKVYPAEKQ
ncbi:MAG: phosphate ABC transporter substrate-binding/OmpA family protein [Planctomycetaceae bacterium]|nr:phosphate ABC transporter substrate-binding/OmpA family protein [Planctomycetaceae bacterium]